MFRVNFYPCIEGMGDNEIEFQKTTETIHNAVAIKEAIADYTLLLHSSGLMMDYSNMSVIEMLHDGEWLELEDYEVEELLAL